MGTETGMLVVETIVKIRRAYFVQKKPIKAICREFRLSRKDVRKAIRGSSTEYHYARQVQPQLRLGAYVARLDGLLEANSKRLARERLFTPRLHFANYAELNAWLEARCLAQARESAHPEQPDKTVWEVFEAERASLIAYRGPFDGFREVEAQCRRAA